MINIDTRLPTRATALARIWNSQKIFQNYPKTSFKTSLGLLDIIRGYFIGPLQSSLRYILK